MSTQDVVRTVVYLRDINDAPLVAKAHSEVFDGIRPASSLIRWTRCCGLGRKLK
jgi:hypothetical protein